MRSDAEIMAGRPTVGQTGSRIALAFLAGCLAVTLSACGQSRTDSDAADAEPVTASDAGGAQDAEQTQTDDDIKTSETVFAAATIEETVLYDAGGVTVTATGFDAAADYGPEISVSVTNDSDAVVDVIAQDVAVNDYMMDPGLLYVVAEPGQTAEGEITLYHFDLDARGIDTVATVSLIISVMDDATYEEIGSGDRITLTTSAADGFYQDVDDTGDVIYDAGGIRVVSQGLRSDGSWDGDLVLFVENGTDRYIGVSGTDVFVNGQAEENTMFWADLTAGTRTVGGMYLMNIDDQELNSIDDVEEITLTLRIIDQDSAEQIAVSDPITLYFP